MLGTLLSSFLKRENGNVAMIVAIAMMPMAVSAGVAIDFIRAHLAKTSLQQAIDAAGLASGTDTDTTNAQVLSMAQAFLNANTQGLVIDVEETAISVQDTNGIKKIDIQAKAKLDTTFMRLVNVDTLEVDIQTSIQRKEAGPLQVALVLDITDSMSSRPQSGGTESKIVSLRAAATSLVNDLMTPTNTQVQFAVVPYAGYVRVRWANELSPVPNWISPQSRTDTCSGWTQTTNCGTTCCMRDGLMRCDLNCCPWVCSNPTHRTYNWVGCAGPRVWNTNGTYTTAFLTTIANPTSPRYPGVPENAWQCPGARLQQLTNNRSTVLTRISQMGPGGDTFIPSGLTWGWNVLASGDIYGAESVAALRERGGRKVLVLMTDGINALNIRTSDGLLVGNGGNATATNTLTQQICTQIKNAGIEIFTVLFDVRDLATENMLRSCASTPSMAFSASDGQGLRNAFGSIGNQLRTVRLSQ